MRAHRRPTAVRTALMCASALGGSLFLTVAAPAQAQSCGSPSPLGIISCGAAGSPYTAINYTGLSGGRVLLLEEGVTAQSVLFTGTGALTVGAGGAHLVTTANDISAINVNSSNRGAVTVTAGDITTSGSASHGIYAETYGVLNVTSGVIRTSGDGAKGIFTRNTTAAGTADLVTITSTAITTTGANAYGMDVNSRGDVTVTSGTVNTSGAGARGLAIESRSHLVLNSNAIVTTGDNATGLWAIGIAQAQITSGSIETSGANAVGLWFAGSGATLTSQSIITRGAGSHGMALSPSGGTITSGSIHTYGAGARGISIGDESSSGLVTINSTTIVTEGEDATGISIAESRVVNPGGAATPGMAYKVNGGDITTRGDDARGIAVATYGNLDIGARAIVTEGFGSSGMDLRGANVTARATSISTQGGEAAGLDIFSGGNAVVEVGTITTAGSASDGVSLYSAAGADIRTTTVRTSGSGSRGIDAFVLGDLTLNADDVRTTGGDAEAIRAISDHDATVTLGHVEATGAGSDAVQISAENALKVAVGRRLSSASGAAADLSGHSVELNIAAGAVVSGGNNGLLLFSDTTSTVTNAGSISSNGGHVIRAFTGATTLNNTGTVRGALMFAGLADVVNNTGVFDAVGVSDFGGGQDIFNNNAGGTFTVGGAAPVAVSFINLEQFNNAGVIDLANGIAGDVLTLSGTLNNAVGSRIQLDVDLSGATPVADRVNVAALQGAAVLQVQVQGTGALGDTGVTLIGSGAAQTGQEFTVETLGGGFVDYDIAYDAAAHSYQLIGALADQAFEPTKVASGAQTQWRRGADAVSARMADLRDNRGTGDRQVWAQAFGGRDSIGGRNGVTTEDVDLSHDVHVSGLAVGADMLVDLAGGQATLGVVGGAGRTELTFLGNGDVSEFKSVSVGAYGQWAMGRFAVAGLVKGEFHDLTYDWASADVSDEAEGDTWGARFETSYRLGGDGWFVEPAAAVAWNTTDLDGIADDAGSVAFGDTTSLTGKIGLRGGWRIALSSGATVQPYGGVYLNREFDGDNASTLTFGSTVVEVTDEGRKGWGEVVFGANVQTPSGWGGFAQVEVLEGDVEGYAGRIGMRLAW